MVARKNHWDHDGVVCNTIVAFPSGCDSWWLGIWQYARTVCDRALDSLRNIGSNSSPAARVSERLADVSLDYRLRFSRDSVWRCLLGVRLIGTAHHSFNRRHDFPTDSRSVFQFPMTPAFLCHSPLGSVKIMHLRLYLYSQPSASNDHIRFLWRLGRSCRPIICPDCNSQLWPYRMN